MISVVLPIYNEEKNIEKVLDGIVAFFTKKALPFEIIAVNDGSKDKTLAILQGYNHQQNLVVVNHEKNRGYGAALRSGFDKAQGDLIFFMDSDGQFNIEDITPFLEKIPNYDFVIGYRQHRQDSFLRVINASILRGVAFVLFGIKVKDVDGAFKLFKKNVIKSLSLSESGILINLELFILAKKKQYTFLELPVRHFERKYGTPTGANLVVLLKVVYRFFGLYQRTR